MKLCRTTTAPSDTKSTNKININNVLVLLCKIRRLKFTINKNSINTAIVTISDCPVTKYMNDILPVRYSYSVFSEDKIL